MVGHKNVQRGKAREEEADAKEEARGAHRPKGSIGGKVCGYVQREATTTCAG